ncbi:MAG: polyprenyl diphosphate synthase [Candidatus Pacebacteria bacterium]|jgi:undecaprenyl diphosphate synthase|nr:polyprenyl diphosphate synthase [Candidatus Paceibacterota bacterium]MDD3072388.1 polyprenyl diphosphate synthase [Candidatus Paceibacterota bacterium]MDD3729001.1 polyprenyl diphosphate synthase [Candidatus Paceibacterota bacterium]MDD4201628.1 polyprenyl diphosphate synthase [Candidatus Paceibacterota bacterium]MDD4467225.1 polyprenyl diphosphate synthase [Candidatus Paceibacterota bacterium]
MEKKIPYHLGLIIDGNRRWAREKNLPVFSGHKKGLENLERIGDYLLLKGVKILTVYVFSYENWKRAEREVNFLMRLLLGALSDRAVSKLHKKGVKINIIGSKEKLSSEVKKRIKIAQETTKDNKKGILNLAVSYSGRREIVSAVKKIIEEKISVEKITEDFFEKFLYTENMSHPDLIIRTGGEHRLSNFLIWQSAYSELYFSNKMWPSFNERDIDKALIDYSKRERRFGK